MGGRPDRPAHHLARLAGLLAAGLGMVAMLAAFVLLYLRVPPGWDALTGHAPAIAPVFLRAFPYPTVVLAPTAFRRAALGLLVAMSACYGLGVWLLSRTPEAARRAALFIVGGVCLFGHVLLVLLPPSLSTDLYDFALYGRMAAVHHLNPYLHPAATLAGDPLAPFAGWLHLRYHEGAAFLWVAVAAAVVGGGGPIGTALAFKSAAAAFNLAACWAVHRLARETSGGDGLGALLLYAWNPLVLVEAAGSGHPDTMMVALALLGAWLWWRGRTSGGVALLTASAAVKYMTGVLGLLVVVQTVATTEPGRRAGVTLRLIAVSALTVLVLYLPFLRGGAPWTAATEVVLRGRALAAGQEATAADTPWVALALFAVLLAVAVVVAARGARTRVFELSAALVTFLVLFALRWRMPWYFICGIGLTVPAAPTPTNRILCLVILLLGTLALLLYGAVVPIS
jgi:hypothetical protein